MQTFTDFLAAQAHAEVTGKMLCGTCKDGEPVYFAVAPGVTDEEVHEISFQIQNGRPRTDDEKRLYNLVRELKPEAFEVQQ